MHIAAVISAILHVTVFLIGWLSVLPSTLPVIAPAQVIDVEIATELQKPVLKPEMIAKKKPAPPPPPPPKPQVAAKPEPAIKSTPASVPVPKPRPRVKKPPKPKAEIPQRPKPKVKKPAKPTSKQVAQKPRPRPKPKPKPLKPKHDFTSVLKTVRKLEQKQSMPEKRKPKEAVSPMQQMAAALKRKRQTPRPDLVRTGITAGDVDAIRRQIEPCWNLPAGARDADKMVVEIKASVGPDGRVRSAMIVDRARATKDRYFRSMAESAVRAMLNPRCQPLRLPKENYHQWRNMTLTFYPGEMF